MRARDSVIGVVAMTFVFGVAVATSVPAASLATVGDFGSVQFDAEGASAQVFAGSGDGDLPAVARDGYVIHTPTPTPTPKAVSSQGGYGGAQCQAGADASPEATEFSWVYPDGFRMSDGFGPRAEGFHKGVDMLNGPGVPVHAIAAGTVIAASGNGGTGGVYLAIAHKVGGQALCSMYMHFQDGSLMVGVGDAVTAGQVIGLTGRTGNATTEHTHFELYGADGARFDPMPFMTEHAG
ncbi:M23 family metallopeptidase [Herbiconiux moechotypicola]|uniref:M23ase beta-sheet core domain-containing protein n=1 Tax=Herbiconiux moechotypicola TaxID=637393 RepID=A0ABP5QTW7_9MICO|nr:M23 family metallopeptidase [Herbiconiux moechotypicola]MCS5730877.1 M23 family metallopeptidase [Herbiconiux moechotypicola]